MSQPVPQYWDMDEVMPDIDFKAWEIVERAESTYFRGISERESFYDGAKAMWDRLKAEGSIKR